MLRSLETLIRQDDQIEQQRQNLLELIIFYGVGAEARDESRRLFGEMSWRADALADSTTRQYLKQRLSEVNTLAAPWGERLFYTEDEQRRRPLQAALSRLAADRNATAFAELLSIAGLLPHEARTALDGLRRSLLDAGDLLQARALSALYPEHDMEFWQTNQHVRLYLKDIAAAHGASNVALAHEWLETLSRWLPAEQEERFRPEITTALVKMGLIDEALRFARQARRDRARAAAWTSAALALLAKDTSRGVALADSLLRGTVEGVTFEHLAAAPVDREHAVSEGCRPPRKRLPSVDAQWRYLSSGFIDCGYEPEDRAAMVLALDLFRRTSSSAAAEALVRFERIVRQLHHPVGDLSVDNSARCQGYQHSLEIAPAYLSAEAHDIVRTYLQAIVRQCALSRYEASQIARHLTTLGSHEAVSDRLRMERTLDPGSEIIEPILGGILEGLASAGEIDRLEPALLAMRNHRLGFAHLVWGIEAYISSPTNLAIEPLLSRALALYARFGEARPEVGVDLVAFAKDRGYSRLASEHGVVAERFLLNAVNQKPSQQGILALAELQLLDLERGGPVASDRVARELRSEAARNEYLALYVDALVTVDQLDAARKLAAALPRTPVIPGVYRGFDPHDYAWTRIAEGLARQGDLPQAFQLGVLEKRVSRLDRLVREWEVGRGFSLTFGPLPKDAYTP